MLERIRLGREALAISLDDRGFSGGIVFEEWAEVVGNGEDGQYWSVDLRVFLFAKLDRCGNRRSARWRRRSWWRGHIRHFFRHLLQIFFKLLGGSQRVAQKLLFILNRTILKLLQLSLEIKHVEHDPSSARVVIGISHTGLERD